MKKSLSYSIIAAAYGIGLTTFAALFYAYLNNKTKEQDTKDTKRRQGQNRRRRRRQGGVCRGLVNLGSTTCFVNATIQCMASVEAELRPWLEQAATLPRQRNRRLVYELIDLMALLNDVDDDDDGDQDQGGQNDNDNDNEDNPISTRKLLDALTSRVNMEILTQQDCHEFFQLLCEHVTSDFAPGGNISAHGFNATPIIDPLAVVLPKTQQLRLPFQGLMAIRLRCHACQTNQPVYFEQFTTISLSVSRKTLIADALQIGESLPSSSTRSNHSSIGMRSVSSLLKVLLGGPDELLFGATCEKCSAKDTLRKRISIAMAPSILCIHVSRSQWSAENGTAAKCNDVTSFEHSIDIEPLLFFRRKQPLLYDLTAVLVHHGSLADAGHFTCFRQWRKSSTASSRSSFKSTSSWCLTNDEHVSVVSKDVVDMAQPYMLFYLRRQRETALPLSA